MHGKKGQDYQHWEPENFIMKEKDREYNLWLAFSAWRVIKNLTNKEVQKYLGYESVAQNDNLGAWMNTPPPYNIHNN